jgi:hypothetical protein
MEGDVLALSVWVAKGLEGFLFGGGGEGEVGDVGLLARSLADLIGDQVFDRLFGLGFSGFGDF